MVCKKRDDGMWAMMRSGWTGSLGIGELEHGVAGLYV